MYAPAARRLAVDGFDAQTQLTAFAPARSANCGLNHRQAVRNSLIAFVTLATVDSLTSWSAYQTPENR